MTALYHLGAALAREAARDATFCGGGRRRPLWSTRRRLQWRLSIKPRTALADQGAEVAPVIIGQRVAHVRAFAAGLTAAEFEPAGKAAQGGRGAVRLDDGGDAMKKTTDPGGGADPSCRRYHVDQAGAAGRGGPQGAAGAARPRHHAAA